ncbi:Ig-like domain-containing protein, partial [Chitinophaga sp.]|uniref:Ig-like domain-containing protein n=1 Tax=Chitinophaga sp. TaxID=1869181 RepID=UPI002B583C64
DSISVTEDTPATGNVLTNDTDPEGNALTASLVTAPVNGTVVLNADGSFTYTPNANYSGSDSLIYQVCDNGTPSLCDTATLLLNISAVNHAPVAVNDSIAVTEDIAATGNVRSNDSDRETPTDSLMVSLLTGPVHGTVVLNNDGSFTYTPNANYSGADSLIYKLCDPDNLCDTAKAIFTIAAANDAPVAVPDSISVTEDTPATGNVLTNDTDPEGNALTASLVTASVNGTVVLNADGSFTYTPNANYSGPDSLIYKVCDNGTPSQCDTAAVLFNIAAVNDSPVAVNDSLTTQQGVPLNGNVLLNDTDTENGALTASVVATTANGTLTLRADGTFSYTSAAGFTGMDMATYKVCDPGGACDTALLVITVTSPPEAPLIGAAMSAVEPVLQPDGSSYRTTFTIKIKNYGNVRLQQVSATDNLAAAFTTPAGFRVVSAVANGGLLINKAFNGAANQQLLLAGSALEAGETGTISLVLDIIPNGNFGPFNNSVTVTGTSPAGALVSDVSNNGAEADPNGNGSPADNGEDLPTPVSPKANVVAGIAKTVSEPVLEINGDYTITYTLVVQNLGNVPVTDVQVTDDLSAVFAPPITYSLIGDIIATGGLLANNTFNGSNNIDLLAAGSNLAVGAADTIRFVVRITPNKQSGTFNNSAFLKGSGGGVAVSDQSTNGLQADPDGNGVPDESVATPVTLNPTRLHIPGGFSPNGDGRNDRFVIGNAGNDKISLEMYNRWGNAVYKNTDYKNNWDGRSNQGVHPGDVVPDGTYYYIITVNGNDRIAGFITIMR